MKHLIDTKPQVAICPRCATVLLAASASGCRAAVEPTPLNFDEARKLIVAGHDVYRMFMQNGRPTKLELVTVTTLKLPAAPYGTYALAHGCGAHAMDAKYFEDPPPDPSQAPVSAERQPDGLHRPNASDRPAQGQQSPASPSSRATTATDRRSRLPAIRCAQCGGLIEAGDINRFQIEWPIWDEYTHHVPNRGIRKGFTKTYAGWGTERWAIHTGGCDGEK